LSIFIVGENMALRKKQMRAIPTQIAGDATEDLTCLFQLDVGELTGHNLEARGREEVNRLLREGWHLLHIYTLKYQEDDVWRERPMAILGRSRTEQARGAAESSCSTAGEPSETSLRKELAAEAGARFAA
jgi:hypothetical protein